jgi:hypothetical protein
VPRQKNINKIDKEKQFCVCVRKITRQRTLCLRYDKCFKLTFQCNEFVHKVRKVVLWTLVMQPNIQCLAVLSHFIYNFFKDPLKLSRLQRAFKNTERDTIFGNQGGTRASKVWKSKHQTLRISLFYRVWCWKIVILSWFLHQSVALTIV